MLINNEEREKKQQQQQRENIERWANINKFFKSCTNK